jgi:hypothetical protein
VLQRQLDHLPDALQHLVKSAYVIVGDAGDEGVLLLGGFRPHDHLGVLGDGDHPAGMVEATM